MIFIKKNIPLLIIIVFHVVGFIGFIYKPDYFKALSPINLMRVNKRNGHFIDLFLLPLSWAFA